MGLVTVSYFLSTLISFGISWAYYQIYKTTGYDPIGNVFGKIMEEEQELEKQAEKALFIKN